MSAYLRRSLALGTLLTLVLSTSSVHEFVSSITPVVETASAQLTGPGNVNVTLTGPKTFSPGQELEYRITVSNDTVFLPSAIKTLTNIPGTTTFVSAGPVNALPNQAPCSFTPGASTGRGVVDCRPPNGTLAQGQASIWYIRIRADNVCTPFQIGANLLVNNFDGWTSNIITATCDGSTPAPVDPRVGNINIEMTGPTSFSPGQELEYRITVSNRTVFTPTTIKSATNVPGTTTFVSHGPVNALPNQAPCTFHAGASTGRGESDCVPPNNTLSPGQTSIWYLRIRADNTCAPFQIAANLVVNGFDGWTSNIITANPSCASTQSSNPIGHLDLASCDLIAGWAFDADAGANPIDVHVYANGPAGQGGQILGSTLANAPRADLTPVVGSPNHGYNFAVPASLKDGQPHTIYTYAINQGGGSVNTMLIGSPKTIQCTAINCNDINYIKQQIAAQKIRFAEAWDQSGFLVWNETTCNIPVTKALFKINGPESNQSLQVMQHDTIPAGAFQRGILIPRPAGSCWGQYDLVFGQHPILPVGTDLQTFINAVNWNVNGLSGYIFGSAAACPNVPSLSISKTGPASVSRGDTFTYQVTVTNTGTSSAQNAVVTDNFPAPLNFVPAQSDSRCSLSAAQRVTCTIPSLAANQSVVMNLTFNTPVVNGCSSTNISNTATVQATNGPVVTSQSVTTSLDCPAAPNPPAQCNDSQVDGANFAENNLPLGTILTTQLQSQGISFSATNGGRIQISDIATAGGLAGPSNGKVVAINTIPPGSGPMTTATIRFVNPATGQQASVSQLRLFVSDTNATPNPRVVLRARGPNGLVSQQTLTSLGQMITFPGSGYTSLEMDDTGGDGFTIDDISFVLDCGSPNLQITKTPAQNTVVRGNDLTYTITVTNSGQAAAQNVIITDPIPVISNGQITFNDAQSYGPCFVTGNTVSCPVGTIDAGQTLQIPLSFHIGTVNDSCSPGSSISLVNTASVAATSINSVSTTAPSVTVQCGNVGTPNLRITKVPLQNTVTRGGTAFYRVTVENVGNAIANNVQIYDQISSISNGTVTFNRPLSSQACYPGSTNSQVVYGPPIYGSPVVPLNQSAVCFLGNLSAGSQVQVILAFDVGSAADQCTVGSSVSLTNAAQVRVSGVQHDATTSQPITVQCANPGNPNLNISKTAQQFSVNRGGVASYVITVSNTGQGAAQNVQIRDTIPTIPNGTVTFNAAQSSNICSLSGNQIVCNVASLAAAQTLQVTLAFNVGSANDQCTAGTSVNMLNTASVQASNSSAASTVTANPLPINCVTGQPNLSISKTTTQGSQTRGGVVTYNVTVTNNGNATANNVVITDPLPSIPNGTVTFLQNSSSNICSLQGSNVVCNVGTVNAGQSAQVTLAFQVGSTTDQCTPGTSVSLSNTATVSATGLPNTSSTANGVNISCVTNTSTTLGITSSVQPTTVQRGGIVTYSVTVTNTGNNAATNVVVRDPIPTLNNGQMTFSAANSSQVCSLNSNNGTIQCLVGTLQPGQQAQLTISYVAGSATDACTSGSSTTVNNTIFAGANNAPEVSSNAPAVTVQCVTGNPAISITKTANQSTIQRGGTASYTITVTNTGNAAAQNVTVVDPMPSISNGTVTFNSNASSNICSLQGANIVCLVGTLNAGQQAQMTLVFNVGSTNDQCSPGTSVSLANSATVSATGIGNVTANAQGVTVQCTNPGNPNLSITKVPNQTNITRGGIVTYTVTVTNTGGAAAQQVLVLDSIPSISNGTVTFNSNSSSNVCALLGSNQVQCSVGTLQAGQNAVLTLAFNVGSTNDSCTVGSSATLNNSASAQATSVSPVTANAQGVNVQCANTGNPNLSITKTANQSTITRGGTASYAITVTNNGTATAQNVVVTDPIPSISNGTVTFNAGQSSNVCSVSGNNVVCNVGNLTAGQQANLTIVFNVGSTNDQCSTGSSVSLANTASVAATGQSSVSASAQNVTVQCPNTGTPSLTFTKTANQSTVQRGGIATYTLSVTNNGTATASNVVITDPIPSITNGAVNFNSNVSNNICSQQGVNVVCNVGSLSAGQTASVNIGFTVGSTSDTCSAGSTATLSNSATVTATGLNSQNASAGNVSVQCNVVTGGLTIAITDNASTVNPGGVLTYNITVTNPSSTAQTNVTVTAQLHSLLSFLNASENGFANGQLVTWNNLTIPANGTKNLNVQAQVSSSAANGAQIVTSAQVNGQTASDITSVTSGNGSGNLSISVTDSPDPVEPCEEITYTIRVTNSSSQTATNVTVNQTFDSSDLDFVSASNGGFSNGNGVRWDNLTIPAGGQTVLTSRAEVDCNADDGDLLRSTVSTTNFSIEVSTRVDDNGGSNNDDLSITVTGDPSEVEIGDTIEYRIRVTNDGNSDRTVDVRAELDPDTTFLDASNNGDEDSDDEVVWDNIRISKDQTKTLTLEVRVRNTAEDGQNLRLEARIPGDSDTETTRVVDDSGGSTGGTTGGGGSTNVSVTKSADRFEANPGDDVTYTVTIRNDSTKALKGLQVSDSFPSDLLQVTEAGGGSATTGGIRWTIDLGANQTRTLIYRARISFGARPGEVVHNSVFVSGNNINGAGSSSDVRILGKILPQTGASEYTGPLEDTSRFLSVGRAGSSEGGLGGLLALLGSAVASVGGGLFLRRRFI